MRLGARLLTASGPTKVARRNWKRYENKLSAITRANNENFLIPHARWQEGDDGEHVLQRINHRYECHDAHRQGIVVAALEYDLVLQEDESQHLEACFDT